MNELEFLKKIKAELEMSEYGEGISFNLNEIVENINKRIKILKKIKNKKI